MEILVFRWFQLQRWELVDWIVNVHIEFYCRENRDFGPKWIEAHTQALHNLNPPAGKIPMEFEGTQIHDQMENHFAWDAVSILTEQEKDKSVRFLLSGNMDGIQSRKRLEMWQLKNGRQTLPKPTARDLWILIKDHPEIKKFLKHQAKTEMEIIIQDRLREEGIFLICERAHDRIEEGIQMSQSGLRSKNFSQ